MKKSQAQLEGESGVHRWKISLGENGLLRLTDGERSALAKVLGTEPTLLLEDAKIPTTKRKAD